MVGVAVVGLGVYGEVHARVYDSMPGVELISICDVRVERAETLSAEFGCAASTDYHDLLANPKIEAISIALPDFLHREVALAAMKAGKHVLVEKPLATETQDCLEMIRVAEESNVHLMTDFSQRWSPFIHQAKSAISGGRLGDVQLVYYRASNTFFVPTKMLSWGGKSSVLWFLASHCLDNLLWIFDSRSAYAGGPGDTIKRLYTVKSERVLARMGYATADFYVTTIEWSSGMVVQLENVWILPDSAPCVFDVKMEFVGASGSLNVDASHNRMIELQTDKAEYLDSIAALDIFGVPTGFAAESIRHFATSIAEGGAPRVDGVDGLAVTRLIHAMEESATVRMPVDIDWNPYAVDLDASFA